MTSKWIPLLLICFSTTAFAERVHVESLGGGGGGGGGHESFQGGGGGGGHEGSGSYGGAYSGGHSAYVGRSSFRGVPSGHTAVIRNNAVIRNIRTNSRVEVVPRHYYSHNINGTRYWHYYDHNRHWYGFYHGSNFYWTRYQRNRWWWYDSTALHWSFFWNGYWWWGAPGGGCYVYVNDGYYPYEPGIVPVDEPDLVDPPEDIPAASSPSGPAASAATPTPAASATNNAWTSPDGQRSVQVVNADSEAFLYDTSSGKTVYMKHLADNVSKVRFTGGKNGKPLQILIDFKDGHFALYDAQGNTSDISEEPSSAPAPAAAAADDMPPIPPPTN